MLDLASTGTASASLARHTGDTVNAGGSTVTGAAVPDGHHDRRLRRASLTYQYLTGGAGNDTITGSGTAYDTIAGGLGNDSIDCGAGDGAVDYTGSATAVVVDLTAGTGTGEGFDSIAQLR